MRKGWGTRKIYSYCINYYFTKAKKKDTIFIHKWEATFIGCARATEKRGMTFKVSFMNQELLTKVSSSNTNRSMYIFPWGHMKHKRMEIADQSKNKKKYPRNIMYDNNLTRQFLSDFVFSSFNNKLRCNSENDASRCWRADSL